MLTALEPPNVLHFEDGTTLPLAGIQIADPIRLHAEDKRYEWLRANLNQNRDAKVRVAALTSGSVQVQNIPHLPVAQVLLKVGRIPYHTEELAAVLLRCHLAEPVPATLVRE